MTLHYAIAKTNDSKSATGIYIQQPLLENSESTMFSDFECDYLNFYRDTFKSKDYVVYDFQSVNPDSTFDNATKINFKSTRVFNVCNIEDEILYLELLNNSFDESIEPISRRKVTFNIKGKRNITKVPDEDLSDFMDLHNYE